MMTTAGLHVELTSFLTLILGIAGLGSAFGATVNLEGEYLSQMTTAGVPVIEHNRAVFRVEMNETVLHISYTQKPLEGPPGFNVSSGPALIEHWISDTNWVMMFVPDKLRSSVVIDRSEYPNVLGNCGDAVASSVFLTVRGLQFFHSMTNSRALAPPWRSPSEPLSLITVAQYGSETHDSITGRIIVDKELLAKWQNSPLLSAAYPDPELADGIAAKMSLQRPGALRGAFRLSGVTNFAGQRFPTYGEFLGYVTPSTKQKSGKKTPVARPDTRRDTVTITHVEESSLPLREFPLIDGQIQVEDRRLSDRELHVVQASFKTNRFDSLELSPQAKLDFEEKKEKARALLQAKARAKLFRRLILAAAVVPLLFFGLWALLSGRRSRGTAA